MTTSNYFAGVTAAFVLAASISGTALAWHPEGKITKYVSNVTTNSAYADANDASTAITAKPGDTLKYKMVIINPANAADKQYNDLAFIKVTDLLPAGVTLVSGSKDKDFGSSVVVPQSTAANKMGNGVKSVEYEFTVKVNADATDKQLICNTATFNANSVVKDAPRSGSDKACVVVSVPKVVVTPPTPTPVPTPKPPVVPQVLATATKLPAVIPATGAESLLGIGTGMTALTYIVAARLQRRK